MNTRQRIEAVKSELFTDEERMARASMSRIKKHLPQIIADFGLAAGTEITPNSKMADDWSDCKIIDLPPQVNGTVLPYLRLAEWLDDSCLSVQLRVKVLTEGPCKSTDLIIKERQYE
jgi:hypothetical protein